MDRTKTIRDLRTLAGYARIMGDDAIRRTCEFAADLLADAQTPRVLTLDELLGLTEGAVVWEEYMQDDGHCAHLTPAVIPAPGILTSWYEQETQINAALLEHDVDGFQLRYWSAKPTDEERRLAPWRA